MIRDDSPRPRLVIFDLDGTLIDSGADIAAAAAHVRRAAGLPPLSDAVTLGYVGDGTRRLVERVLAHNLGAGAAGRPVADREVERGLAAFAEHYATHLLDRTRLYPGIADLLAGLADRRLMVATNKPRRFTLAILAGLGVERLFERVVAGDDAPARKPDPAHLAACLAGTGVAAAAAVMVGDSPHDVLAAQGLGMPAVAVSWGLVGRVRLVAARPTHLADAVDELAALL